MFRDAGRFVPIADPLETGQMFGVERLHRTDRQTDTVHRQRIVFAQAAKLRMRRAAGPHVVFRMDFEEPDALGHGVDRGEMLRLEAGPGTARELGWFHRPPSGGPITLGPCPSSTSRVPAAC